MQPESDLPPDLWGKAQDLWKRFMLYGIEHQIGEKIRASAVVTAAISGFRFVPPVDTPSQIFRYACMVAGIVGFLMLFFSQPQKDKKTGSAKSQKQKKGFPLALVLLPNHPELVLILERHALEPALISDYYLLR